MRVHTFITLSLMSLVLVALLFMSYYKNTTEPVVMTYEEFQRIW